MPRHRSNADGSEGTLGMKMSCRGLRATQTHVENERLARLAGVALEDLLGNVALQKVILEAELGC